MLSQTYTEKGEIMDLRIVKTKNQIKEAFLKLRDKMMPEKIKVKDICDVAMINKTTFYKHYTDSFELSNEIEECAIEKVIASLKNKNNILTQPQEYISGLMNALKAEAANLQLVFKGKYDVLSVKLTDKLLKLSDASAETPENEVRLSFAIGGFVRIVNDYMFTNKNFDLEKLTMHTVTMLEAIPF